LKGLERLPVSKRFLSCDYTEGWNSDIFQSW
jgi:hypothetical protein